MNLAPIAKIVIVGGGTAGWMTAMILAHAWRTFAISITLLESEHIATIGVGEGSTPALKQFFDKLGIAETEWMERCHATYKCGITFEKWSTKPGFESYYHPFASQIDSHTLPAFFRNVHARLNGQDVLAHPDAFFLSAYLAKQKLSPKAPDNFPFEVHYGYHFDANRLGEFLREKATANNVEHLTGTVTAVKLGDAGEISAVTTETGEQITADFFIDCTGFNSLLSQQALGTPYKSYAPQLFNDAAVTIATEAEEKISSQTVSTALKYGWAWKIPLRNRCGNGYVYSTRYCTPAQAEAELRQHLNLEDADLPARHIRMRVGRVEQSWNKNCLAVGLAQGFIEPLEATTLFLIQQTAALFAEEYPKGHFSNHNQMKFNADINAQFDGVRDYIVSHYQTNSRNDTRYWKDYRSQPESLSTSLKCLYQCWLTRGNLESEIKRQGMDRFYPVPSWYCLLSGMGIFPEGNHLHPPEEKTFAVDQIEQFLSRCALNYYDHTDLLLGNTGKTGEGNKKTPQPI